MLRINNIQFNPHGYISTDGLMNISFKTEKSLEEVKELLTESDHIEMYESYVIKRIQSIEQKNGEILLQMEVGAIGSEPEEIKPPELTLETVEDYATAVESKAIALSDVPIDLRENVAVKLGV